MTNTFISGLVQLGLWFRGEIPEQGWNDDALIAAAEAQNRWFVPAFTKQALFANGAMLEPAKLERWLEPYIRNSEGFLPKRIGLVLAGNLPMVGWHDVLCVLLSGHHAIVKCSSQDGLLIPAAVQALANFTGAEMEGRVTFVSGKLESVDAVIATGSANSNRYFEYYFRHIPKILRGQRTSVAVLHGDESPDELRRLGMDVFSYYGMGCRNVTKLFLPVGFDLNRLFAVWTEWAHLSDNNKYANNYDYHKAVWLLNQMELIENGFVLMKKDDAWVSPVGSLFYTFYEDLSAVRSELEVNADALQCVVSSSTLELSGIPVVKWGQTQLPEPWEYADGVDTISFLLALSSSPVER